jgi:hypothetical protein
VTVKHPAGSGASSIISPPYKAKLPKSGVGKAPRRKTTPGEATSTQIPNPQPESPLRSLYALHSGNPDWHVAYGKFPCLCKDWSSKAANCVILWRQGPPAYRHYCECQVAEMDKAQMMEVVA